MSARYCEEWFEHHGKVVRIDGLAYRLSVRRYRAKYPREEEVCSVTAEAVSRVSRVYREIRMKLGDDWVLDVLESAPEVQTGILMQLEGLEATHGAVVAPQVL